MRDNLYAQLKEILMKNDGSKALQDELLKELMKKHNVTLSYLSGLCLADRTIFVFIIWGYYI